jgi:hypothetical protein
MVACACLLFLAVGGVPAEEGNVYLQRARGEIEKLQYDAARGSLERALKSGKSTPAETREIYLLAAEMAATLGDRAGAEKLYRTLLTLDPSAQLPPGASPKLSRPFAAARAAMRGKGVLAVQQEQSGGDRPTATLVVVADPLGLVAGARVQTQIPSGAVSTHVAKGTGRITLSLPRAARIEVLLSAIDKHGNRLVDLGPFVVAGPPGVGVPVGPVGPGPGPGPIGPRPAPGPRQPLFPKWIAWTTAVTAFFVASAVTFGVLTDRTQDDINRIQANSRDHTYSELLAAKRRGDWESAVANASFGAMAAGLAVITVYYIFRLHRWTKTRVTGAPSPGGAVLSLSAGF